MKPRANSTCRRPPGRPQLTLYASRATIDTGLENLGTSTIFAAPGNSSPSLRRTFIRTLPLTKRLGFHLTKPLPEMDGIRSILSGGLDLKRYSVTSYKTNSVVTSEVTFDQNGNPLLRLSSHGAFSVPTTLSTLDYLPLSLNYNANLQDAFGPATWGLGLSANLWYSSSYVDHLAHRRPNQLSTPRCTRR